MYCKVELRKNKKYQQQGSLNYIPNKKERKIYFVYQKKEKI